jgi:hypothetical protein
MSGSAASLADVQRKLDVLNGHCDAIARPRASILRSYLVLPLVLADTAAGSSQSWRPSRPAR